MTHSLAIAQSISLDLRSLRDALQQGVTLHDLLAVTYDRIEHGVAHNVFTHVVPRRQAFAQLDALETLRARGQSLPLYGATFVVKDNIDVAGMPTTAACPAYSYVPERSAPVVQRLLDAGALCVGKANMDQFATGLVGTRSPYGVCRNVFASDYLAGGSSSGSALAVAHGWVTFALGTDTAGSGRVPAALANIVGLKPTPERLSTDGVVPACRSLDCVSVFALCCEDAAEVRDLMQASSATPAGPRLDPARGFRFGVPAETWLRWFDDETSQRMYRESIARLTELGGIAVEVDWAPFAEAGELLYNGPWIAERAAGVGDFVAKHAADCLPVIVDIFATASRFSAVDAFRGMVRLHELKARVDAQWRHVDVLLLPTTPTIPRLDQVAADPRGINDRLGIYTRFANLLRCCALAVPAGMRSDGLPFGISLIAPADHDAVLDVIGAAFHQHVGGLLGATQHALPIALPRTVEVEDDALSFAVVGAHLSGMALNHQLTDLGATLRAVTQTAAEYRLYALPNTTPEKPGLLRVSQDGVTIDVEVWNVPRARVGDFMAQVPSPLAIGNVVLADGSVVKGFVCEAHAISGARDISHYGGFRKYIAGRA